MVYSLGVTWLDAILTTYKKNTPHREPTLMVWEVKKAQQSNWDDNMFWRGVYLFLHSDIEREREIDR